MKIDAQHNIWYLVDYGLHYISIAGLYLCQPRPPFFIHGGAPNSGHGRLLHKDLLHDHCVQFFVDGARSLHADILAGMSWFRPMRIFLDWYHLHEKCKVELSLVLRGKKVRNPVLANLMPLLWLGQVDAAIAYLRTLGSDQIKSGKSVDRLIEYFERNREYIPCYALRDQLGLRNSSNRGEKANDLCVADRQKHRGMSWSREGSVALASITALQRNKELEAWCRSHTLSFDWVA